MGAMKYFLPVFFVIFTILSVYSEDSYIDLKVTHGPILGRPSSTTMSIWVRTNVPGEVSVRYGTEKLKQLMVSEPVESQLENDNTAIITLTNLYPDTLYYYTVDKGLAGSFKTLPDSNDYVDPEHNPKGLFNFQFEYTSCINQSWVSSFGPSMPLYDTLNDQVTDKVHFLKFQSH